MEAGCRLRILVDGRETALLLVGEASSGQFRAAALAHVLLIVLGNSLVMGRGERTDRVDGTQRRSRRAGLGCRPSRVLYDAVCGAHDQRWLHLFSRPPLLLWTEMDFDRLRRLPRSGAIPPHRVHAAAWCASGWQLLDWIWDWRTGPARTDRLDRAADPVCPLLFCSSACAVARGR